MNFFNPLLLSGLGLVAVPIIIHWLFRRRYRRIDWAAIRFLLEAQRETRRRRQFEQWLLLALRCLAMLLLAFFISRPFVQGSSLAGLFAEIEPIERIIVLDDSASLYYRVGNESEFDQLKQSATQLLDWISTAAPQDRVSLLRWTALDQPLFEGVTLDTLTLGEVKRVIAQLKPTPLHATMANLVSVLRQRFEDNDEGRRFDIHLITDQQSTQFEDLAATPLQALTGKDSGVRWIVMPTADGIRDNLAIQQVDALQPYAIAGQPFRIKATIANFGRTAAEDIAIEVMIDKERVPGMKIDYVAPGAEATVEHELVLADPGFPVISLSLPQGDPLSLDNRFGIVLPTKPALKVLIVNERDQQAPRSNSAYFLEQALSPPGPFSSGIMVTQIRPADLSGTSLVTYDVLVLCDVADLEIASLEALQAFVSGGGGLAFFLGPQLSDVTNFNAVFHAGGRGLFPVNLGRRVVATDSIVSMVRASEHTATVALPESVDRTAPLVRFQTFFSSDLPQAAEEGPAQVEVLARFTDAEQNAAIVERRYGRGRVIACLSSIDLRWNNWPAAIDGSFVISMLELVRYLAGEAEYPSALTVGQRPQLSINLDAYESQALLRPPNFPTGSATELTAEITDDVSGRAILGGNVADQLGIYEFVLTPRVGISVTRPVQVNADGRESNLNRATAEQLSEWFSGTDFVLTSVVSETEAGKQTRSELWRPLLMLLIATLLIEQFLAWWFARNAQRRSPPIVAPYAAVRPGR